MNLVAVTYATHAHPGLDRLVRSLERHAWAYRVLGLGQPWRGFGSKLCAVREAIPVLRDAGFTHALFTDGFDTVAFRGPADVTPLVPPTGALVSCEPACWPDPGLAEQYPPTNSRWKYLNSGGYAGELGYLADLLGDAVPPEDDQLYLTRKYLGGNHPLLRRDDACTVFQPLAHLVSFPGQMWEDYFERVDGGGVKNTETGTTPAFLHNNGGGAGRFPDWFLEGVE